MNLPEPSSVDRVGAIGTGTIGASWTAYFLARGMRRAGVGPGAGRRGGAARVRGDGAWPTLDGLEHGRGRRKPRTGSPSTRVPPRPSTASAFVQESAPEKLEVKRALYADIDAALPDGVVMASSTSGLIMSELQAGFARAARFVVGHPFNPPHLVPLVEVVGGADTAATVVDWTIDFYNAHGKKAIRLNHEAPGHLVNRLQAALWREAMDAVLTGLASVEDVDDAIKYGPGLRLSVMGPFELCHLAGGPEGYPNFLDHFGDALQLWMDDMRAGRAHAGGAREAEGARRRGASAEREVGVPRRASATRCCCRSCAPSRAPGASTVSTEAGGEVQGAAHVRMHDGGHDCRRTETGGVRSAAGTGRHHGRCAGP